MHYGIPCSILPVRTEPKLSPAHCKKAFKHQQAAATTVELYDLLITRIPLQPLLIKYENIHQNKKFTNVWRAR